MLNDIACDHAEAAPVTDILAAALAAPTDYRRFQDASVPKGYETAYSYYARTNPEAVQFLYEPVTAIAEEHGELLALTWRRGMVAVEVDAPAAVREFGIAKTLAFPIAVLRRFYR